MPKLAKVTNPNVYGSQTLISQLLGISRGKFQRLEEKGVFVRKNYDGVHPLYLVRECIQSYFDVTFTETTDEDGELLDPVAEKAKLGRFLTDTPFDGGCLPGDIGFIRQRSRMH